MTNKDIMEKIEEDLKEKVEKEAEKVIEEAASATVHVDEDSGEVAIGPDTDGDGIPDKAWLKVKLTETQMKVLKWGIVFIAIAGAGYAYLTA